MPRKPKPTHSIDERPLRFFEVNESGTITDPSVPESKYNRDVFQNVSSDHLKTIEDLIAEVESCYPLARHYADLANSHADEFEDELESLSNLSDKQKGLKLVERMRGDPADDEGWKAWLRSASPEQLDDFKAPIEDWLDQDIDWQYDDWFDRGWSPQDAAKRFFESEDPDVLDALDVVIVEGDHPGSSYYAAELLQDLATANEVAERLNLGYRFRAKSS